MKKLFLGFTFLWISGLTSAQLPINIGLSDKHLVKVENLSSPKEKLKLYRKYYRKDSLRLVKEYEEKFQIEYDSLLTIIQENPLLPNANKISKQTEKLDTSFLGLKPSLWDTVNLEDIPDSILRNKIGAFESKIGLNLPEFSDSLRGFQPQTQVVKSAGFEYDSLVEVSQSIKEIEISRNDLKGYQKQANNYLKRDSLLTQEEQDKSVNIASDKLGERKELKILSEYSRQAREFDPLHHEIDNQYGVLEDSMFNKEQARKMAEEMVMNYITENQTIMKAVQSKMDLLMKKYSIVPNSNDLRSAINRESLRGKSFKERLYLAGNFQVLSLKPFSIDFSPLVGFRFNGRLIAGVGGNFRKTFGDSIARVSADMLGYKVFMNYDVLRNFFGYGEFANNSTGNLQTENGIKRNWSHSFLIGAGRKFNIHPKIEMTVLVLYNFSHHPGNTIYPSQWVVRFGFQLSELAFLKRKPDFKF